MRPFVTLALLLCISVSARSAHPIRKIDHSLFRHSAQVVADNADEQQTKENQQDYITLPNSGQITSKVIFPLNHAAALSAFGEKPREKAEVEIVTLRATGFAPTEIRRKRGRFLLVIQNRSQLREFNITLLVDKGQALRSIKLTNRNPRWTNGLDLNPGIYFLSESNHPSWSCTLIIEAN